MTLDEERIVGELAWVNGEAGVEAGGDEIGMGEVRSRALPPKSIYACLEEFTESRRTTRGACAVLLTVGHYTVLRSALFIFLLCFLLSPPPPSNLCICANYSNHLHHVRWYRYRKVRQSLLNLRPSTLRFITDNFAVCQIKWDDSARETSTQPANNYHRGIRSQAREARISLSWLLVSALPFSCEQDRAHSSSTVRQKLTFL